MIWNRAIRMITKPFYELSRRINPTKFAKRVGVNFGNNCHFYGPIYWGNEAWLITLGDNVYITEKCKFVLHDGGTLLFRKQIPDLEITRPVLIGDNVYIGTETMILGGVHIGNNVVIGARSLVTKDIPDNCVAAGHPARVIKTIDQYLEKISRESLHLGELKYKEKDRELKKYYKYEKR